MSVIGIVCEFNPFHNGHKHLIDTVRKDGDTVVCVMSGNFTQRAEPSVFEKSCRVEAALSCGADIVLELPFVYATATAELFAANAVRILCEFGCDKIAFGVETDNKDGIIACAKLFASDSFKNEIDLELEHNISYPAARHRAFSTHGINLDMSEPNNILAVEYTKAVLRDYPSVEILPCKRKGSGHGSMTPHESIASAEYLRKVFRRQSISPYVPEAAYRLYCQADGNDEVLDPRRYIISLLTLLRSRLYEDNNDVAYVSDELAARINAAVREYTDTKSLDGIYENIKTKRYTASRVRRAVLYKAFDVNREFMTLPAPYIRLLGFRSGSENVIARAKENSGIPLVSTYKEIKLLNNEAVNKVFELESKASDIFNLSLAAPGRCSTEMLRKIIKI